MHPIYRPKPGGPATALKASEGKNVHSSQTRSDDTEVADHVGGFHRFGFMPALPVVQVWRQADSAPQSEVHPPAFKEVPKSCAEGQAIPETCALK